MTTTYTAWLEGGPCDGTQKKLTATQFQSGHTTCSGQTYIKTGAKLPGENVYVFAYQDNASTGSAGSSMVAPKTHHGWNSLRQTFNHVMPSTLRKSQHATDAALRSLAKLPKVRH